MKVVYCVNQLYRAGGLEKMVVQKANWLSRHTEINVCIIVSFALQKPFFPLDHNVRYIDLDIPYYSDARLPRFLRLFWVFSLRSRHRKKLKKTLNSLSPDVVVVADRASMLFVSKINLSCRPLRILEMHMNRDYFMRIYHGFRKKVLAYLGRVREHVSFRGYDRIVVLSEESGWEYGYNNPKIKIISDCVYDKLPIASSLDEKVVIAGGRLVKEKNFASMISAFQFVSARFPDWQLHIYGDGPEKGVLSSLIVKLGLSGKVFLKGHVSDFPSKMNEASVFCLTSVSESFSLVTLEAISAGLPVVAFDIKGGLKNLVKNGVNGFLVPLDSESLLAEKIMLLIEDKERRLHMGQQSRCIAERFTADRIMPQWVDLFYEGRVD